MLTFLDKDFSTLSVDTKSIARAKDPLGRSLRKGWFKSEYVKPQPVPDAFRAAAKKPNYNNSLTMYYIDCEERSSSMMQIILHDADGNVVASWTDHNPNPVFSDVAPETLGETMLDAVCDAKLVTDREWTKTSDTR